MTRARAELYFNAPARPARHNAYTDLADSTRAIEFTLPQTIGVRMTNIRTPYVERGPPSVGTSGQQPPYEGG